MPTLLSVRLTQARTATNPMLLQREVAEKLGVTASAVSLWERGITEPGAVAMASLARLYGVSTDWLLGLDNDTPLPQKRIMASGQESIIFTVPVVAPESITQWRWPGVKEVLQTEREYPAGTAAACPVKSNAMQDVCPQGAYAVVSKINEPREGDIVAVLPDAASKEPAFRRYTTDGGTVLLIADDPRYPAIPMETQAARIVGVVVESIIRRIHA